MLRFAAFVGPASCDGAGSGRTRDASRPRCRAGGIRAPRENFMDRENLQILDANWGHEPAFRIGGHCSVNAHSETGPPAVALHRHRRSGALQDDRFMGRTGAQSIALRVPDLTRRGAMLRGPRRQQGADSGLFCCRQDAGSTLRFRGRENLQMLDANRGHEPTCRCRRRGDESHFSCRTEGDQRLVTSSPTWFIERSTHRFNASTAVGAIFGLPLKPPGHPTSAT